MPYPTQPIASHFINGAYVEDTAGAEIPVIYPATGEQIATVHEATPAIIEQAITSAKAAQKAWAAISGTERGRVLRRAADMIRERNYDLSVLETHDTGKPMSETLYVDATSGADSLEYFGGLAGSLTGEHIQLGEDWVYTRRSFRPLRWDRCVELSNANRMLERRTRAGLWQRDDLQTFRNHAALRFESR